MNILQDLISSIKSIKGDDLACFLTKSKMEGLLVSRILYNFEKGNPDELLGRKETSLIFVDPDKGKGKLLDLVLHKKNELSKSDKLIPSDFIAGFEFKQSLSHDVINGFHKNISEGFENDIKRLKMLKQGTSAECYFVLFSSCIIIYLIIYSCQLTKKPFSK